MAAKRESTIMKSPRMQALIKSIDDRVANLRKACEESLVVIVGMSDQLRAQRVTDAVKLKHGQCLLAADFEACVRLTRKYKHVSSIFIDKKWAGECYDTIVKIRELLPTTVITCVDEDLTACEQLDDSETVVVPKLTKSLINYIIGN